jgi:hypothetical protein
MAKPKAGKIKIRKSAGISNSYVALKSKNEIYYQMASIFKEVSRDTNNMEKNIFTRLLIDNSSDILMENFL